MFNIQAASQLLLILTSCLIWSAKSAPIGDDYAQQIREVGAEPQNRPTVIGFPERNRRWNHADYVLSESEYQQLLERLQRDAEESVSADPRNYVDTDMSIEEIIRLIEASNTTFSTLDGNTTDAPASLVSTTQPTSDGPDNSTTLQTFGELTVSVTELPNLDPAIRTDPIRTRGSATTDASIECSICLDTIEKDAAFVELKCEHPFHYNCIVHWARHVSVTRFNIAITNIRVASR